MNDLRVDAGRLKRDFDALAAIGATPEGGVDRPALGEAHLEARDWFRRRIESDGLDFSVDRAGNHSGRLSASSLEARTLLLGSHLDSVPRGGRFDGALGTLAALEVLRAVRDGGVTLPVHLEAIDFTDEEGTLVGLLGSRAVSGALTAEELEHPRGGRDRLLAGLARAGLDEEGLLGARRDPRTLEGFLELHIEQGPRLLDGGYDIGVVSGIVGFCSYAWTFRGRADHAGTTPMDRRRDAGLASAEFVVEAHRAVRGAFPEGVVNAGKIEFHPGASNVVPERAEVELEVRNPDAGALDAMESALVALADGIARRHDVGSSADRLMRIEPAPCADLVREAFARAAGSLGLTQLELASGAGHDTMAMAAICPAGMIFVPSSGGSHSADEFAEWDACVRGADVMLRAAVDLALQ